MRLPMPSAGKRVDRAFAFVDLSGFTALTNQFGDDRAVAELAVFRWAVREIAGAHGVRVAKWLGDGAMIVAVQAPQLLEAVVALETLLLDHELSLPLRGGLAGGPTLLFEGDDYIGPAVNLAARLCDEADEHELLSTAELADEVGIREKADMLETRSVDIRGFDQPISVVDLAAVLRPRS